MSTYCRAKNLINNLSKQLMILYIPLSLYRLYIYIYIYCKLQVAYNDCMRILLKKPRWFSASDLFCKARVQSFPALMRNLMYKFICRLDNSRNTIIMLLTNPRLTEVRYQSSMRKYWHNVFFKCVLLLFVLSVLANGP